MVDSEIGIWEWVRNIDEVHFHIGSLTFSGAVFAASVWDFRVPVRFVYAAYMPMLSLRSREAKAIVSEAVVILGYTLAYRKVEDQVV